MSSIFNWLFLHSFLQTKYLPSPNKQQPNSQSLTGSILYSILWHKVVIATHQPMQTGGLVRQYYARVDYIPQSETKNLATVPSASFPTSTQYFENFSTILISVNYRARICKCLWRPEIDSASLCSLAGGYIKQGCCTGLPGELIPGLL